MIAQPIIITCTCAIIAIALYAVNRAISKSDDNKLVNISLPQESMTDSTVVDIVGRYRKTCAAWFVIFLLLLTPIWFMMDYFSLSFLYSVLWIVLLFCINRASTVKYSRELYALKKRREWWVGNPHIISIDTEVSRLKDTFPVSKAWFIVPTLMYAVTIIDFARSDWELVRGGIALHTLIVLVVCFCMYIARVKDKSVTYSDNTDINIAINRSYKREWSKCFVFMACAESVISAIATLLFTDNILYMSVFFTASCFFVILPVALAIRRINSVKNSLKEAINNVKYEDDDKYWTKFFYSNPNDSRILAGTRMGTATNVNMARSGVKAGVIASLFTTIGLIVFLTIIFIPLDFASITVDFSSDNVTIHAPLDEYIFAHDDIKQVTLVDDISVASKIIGGADSELYFGRFNVSGYGVSMVYLYRDNPPYIAIELSSGWIFLNGESVLQTEEYYEILRGEDTT